MDRTAALPLRPIEPAEFDAFWATTELAFGGYDGEAEREVDRLGFECDRSLAAYDGDEIVGTAGIFSLEMTVPGGPAAVAGVTFVGVRPTHRRRGLLTALMTRQLRELHDEQREPVAALWASESVIYGRFGYGQASRGLSVDVPRSANAFLPGVPGSTGRLRMVEPAKARPDLQRVFEQVRPHRPGFFARTDGFWATRLLDDARQRSGASPLRAVLHEIAGSVDGYALYANKPDWADGLPSGVVTVREVVATTPAGYAALWRFLLDLDLTGRVRCWNLAADDPLLHLLANPRAARAGWHDQLWVRLVDVGRALTARSYAATVDVVVEVTDQGCPWNAARWRLAADTSGASCERSTAAPDVRLSTTELGAAYLGGTTLSALAGAGRVAELRPGALSELSRAFAGIVEPYCPLTF